jgi:5'-nucleotidase
MNRRIFLIQSGKTAALLSLGSIPLSIASSLQSAKLVILHTNDVHSRVDPFPMDGSRNQGQGGVLRRARLIEEIRSREPNVLLFDSGDIFQGTPYFNFFKGEIELKLMSEMGYDAATIGNHDFDAGIDGLLKQLPHANFPFVSCNYDFSETPLAGMISSYQVFEKAGIRIGVFGLGIELYGLVPERWYENTRYLDPVSNGNNTAKKLKKDLDCDYIICLSHLGYRYRDNKIDDVKLAAQSKDIDLILGGHTHTFMESPVIVKNLEKQPVVINQVGWGGLILGRLNIDLDPTRRRRCITCENLTIEQKTPEPSLIK